MIERVVVEWPYIALVSYKDGFSQKTRFSSPTAALRYSEMMRGLGQREGDDRVVKLYRVFAEEVTL